MAPLGLGLLLPFDIAGGALDDNDRIPALSLSNVSDNSNTLWIHGAYGIFCTAVAFAVLYLFYDKVLNGFIKCVTSLILRTVHKT